MRKLLASFVALGSGITWSQPVAGNAVRVNDVTLYPDFSNNRVFYYPPGRLKLAQRSDGSPELSLIQLRYVGTSATEDQGKFLTRSAFTFRLVMEHRPDTSLRKLKADLSAKLKRSVNIAPLPIAAFETNLLYTPVDADKVDAGKGEAESLGGWSPTEYWTERIVTVYPGSATSQLLWDQLKKGNAAMTVSYAFVAHGVGADGDEKSAADFTALADSIPILVDTVKYPDAMRQIDLNERAPANFPLLTVYCFDFKEDRAADLVERQIEIEATGVTGKTITSLVRFRSGEKDVYSAKARFKFAIDMKKGYRYRVRNVTGDGNEQVENWMSVDNWTKVLDVTTKAGDKL